MATATAVETTVIAVAPISVPETSSLRGLPLQVRVSALSKRTKIPVVSFGHGFGASHDDYQPLVHLWASHGSVVVQPTFLDAATLALPPTDPRPLDIRRFRVPDMKAVLDNLDTIIPTVPGMSGRLDLSQIAVAGHSHSDQTVGMLLGRKSLLRPGCLVPVKP